ncbi:hypothetical protein BB934_34920 (plasmid) [Microvirga ossetica]|uniref:Uncharacterized protein n=1 Tax=Microvirga ossetica TaxID=1882682 RepID=A0A1B2EU27_9HYPH|nr:hypothetical protein BB934_34920 [Microvirga ossetica]
MPPDKLLIVYKELMERRHISVRDTKRPFNQYCTKLKLDLRVRRLDRICSMGPDFWNDSRGSRRQSDTSTANKPLRVIDGMISSHEMLLVALG